MPILFCNIGWMERYQGLQPGDKITGGGAYVKQKGTGHEVCNFSPQRGTFYGYVQVPGQQINIERIGASNDDDSIKGTTIVWTATRPSVGTTIVGWYRNATVFRNYQKFKKKPAPQSRNRIDGYWIKAPLASAKLLPLDERVFKIPHGVKGGMGQSNIWYADSPESAPLLKRVRAMVNDGHAARVHRQNRGRPQDQDQKARVEGAAIRACCAYFEKLSYKVTSVEKDNVGWDLVAEAGKALLRVEVKGLSGAAFSIELTPNEYNAFTKREPDYRLAVVVNALKNPVLSICRYSKEQRDWVVEGKAGRTLEIKIKQSASITCI